MTAQEQWLMANAAWVAAGLLSAGALLGMLVLVVIGAGRRRAAARRSRRAERFRSAVRNEARRIVGGRPRVVEEVDELELTRIFERPRPVGRSTSANTSVERRRSAEPAAATALDVTAIIERGAVFKVLGDEAG